MQWRSIDYYLWTKITSMPRNGSSHHPDACITIGASKGAKRCTGEERGQRRRLALSKADLVQGCFNCPSYSASLSSLTFGTLLLPSDYSEQDCIFSRFCILHPVSCIWHSLIIDTGSSLIGSRRPFVQSSPLLSFELLTSFLRCLFFLTLYFLLYRQGACQSFTPVF